MSKTETQNEFQEFLKNKNACQDAIEWVKGRNLKESYEQCERADWLLWIAGKMIGKPNWPTHKQVVLATCDCAEMVLYLIPHNEKQPQETIEIIRKWTEGKATIEQVKKAAAAAAAAARAAAAGGAAAAARAAADAAYAAADAAYAADYAAYAAADAAYAAAKKNTHKKMCAIIRQTLTCPEKF